MKSKFLFAIFCIVITGCNTSPIRSDQELPGSRGGEVDANFGSVVTSSPGSDHLWIFAQWHLSPGTDTHEKRDEKLEQQVNQTAIYKQLTTWLQNGKIKTVYAEGCEGEITENSKIKFNGWNLVELRKVASLTTYPEIVSHIPLKLKAKFAGQVRIVCVDDESLIRQQNLLFSDARGFAGYFIRLSQYRNDLEKAKPYLDDVVKYLHMAKETPVALALPSLRVKLQDLAKQIRTSIEERNMVIFKKITADQNHGERALVIGALHESGLAQLATEAKVGFDIVHPVGLNDDAAELLEKLEHL